MSEASKEIEKQKQRNILIVLSGPTCSGKDSVMRNLLRRNKNMRRLVTTNSRPKRKEEKEGIDYYFISKEQFEKLIAQEAFLEWVEYRGDYRGSQKKHVLEALKSGKDVIWRIDVRGVKNIYNKVKKEVPYSMFVFLAEGIKILEKRMKKRATETKTGTKWSLNRAIWELRQYRNFDYLVENKEGKLKKTVEIVEKIIEAEKRKILKK